MNTGNRIHISIEMNIREGGGSYFLPLSQMQNDKLGPISNVGTKFLIELF